MVTGKSELLLHKFSNTPWAVHLGMFDIFTNVLNNKMQGLILKPVADCVCDGDESNEPVSLTKYRVVEGVAILDLEGVVFKKKMGMEGVSGMVATLDIEKSFKAALGDTDVKAILLNIDSPGGTVDGTSELADLIYNSRGVKPIYAIANGMMASAAYWIASAADKVFAGSSSDVGSIGVYMMHIDQSRFDEAKGIKVTYVKAGKYKTVGNPHEPLSDSDKDVLQGEVDYIYDMFISAVARNRGLTKEEVLVVAEGKTFIGQQAVDAKLVDSLETLDNLISQSDKYSFLKGDKAMFDKKLKDATLEEFKAERTDLFDAIVASVESNLKTELATLKAKNERDAKIRGSASKLNLVAKGEELIATDKALEDCLSDLIAESGKQSGAIAQAFAATAPESAGSPAGSELDLEEPKTQEQAMQYCMKQHSCSRKEAWHKAKEQYPSLFIVK